MQLLWAVLLGLVAGVAVAGWLSRDTPEQAREKRARAEQAAAADYEDSRPVLYRWRDDGGALHVTDTAPKGRKYERIPIEPAPAIEVRGDRPSGPRCSPGDPLNHSDPSFRGPLTYPNCPPRTSAPATPPPATLNPHNAR